MTLPAWFILAAVLPQRRTRQDAVRWDVGLVVRGQPLLGNTEKSCSSGGRRGTLLCLPPVTDRTVTQPEAAVKIQGMPGETAAA